MHCVYGESGSSLLIESTDSAVRQVGFITIQFVVGGPIVRLKQAKDVCWLSHQAPAESLHHSMVS